MKNTEKENTPERSEQINAVIRSLEAYGIAERLEVLLKEHKAKYGSGCDYSELLSDMIEKLESPEIETDDLEITSINGECGNSFKFKCPECRQGLEVATDQWWETDCRCGYTWHLTLKAVGGK